MGDNAIPVLNAHRLIDLEAAITQCLGHFIKFVIDDPRSQKMTAWLEIFISLWDQRQNNLSQNIGNDQISILIMNAIQKTVYAISRLWQPD